MGAALGIHTGANFVTISIFDLRTEQVDQAIPSGFFNQMLIWRLYLLHLYNCRGFSWLQYLALWFTCGGEKTNDITTMAKTTIASVSRHRCLATTVKVSVLNI